MKIPLELFKDILSYAFGGNDAFIESKFSALSNLETRKNNILNMLIYIRENLHSIYTEDKFPITKWVDERYQLKYGVDGILYSFDKEMGKECEDERYQQIDKRNLPYNVPYKCVIMYNTTLEKNNPLHKMYDYYTHYYLNELDHFFTTCLNDLFFKEGECEINIQQEKGLRLVIIDYILKKYNTSIKTDTFDNKEGKMVFSSIKNLANISDEEFIEIGDSCIKNRADVKKILEEYVKNKSTLE